MVDQIHWDDKLRACAFQPEYKVAHLVMQVNYGKVFKCIGDGKFVQAYPNLPHVKEDERETEAALRFIGEFSYGPNGCFKINKNLDTHDMMMIDVQKASSQLIRMLRSKPEEKFFHITFVAGHGMHW